MKTATVAFLISLFISALLTPVIRSLALAKGLVDDNTSSRKIHSQPVPRLGGIAIVCAYYGPLIGLLLYETDLGRMFWNTGSRAWGLIIGGIIIALLGVYDDLKGARAMTKFTVQFAVAGLMYYMGFRIGLIANPFGASLDLGWLSLPFTLFWIVGVINAMNLIDGIDGLAGGVGLFCVGTLFVLSITRHDPLLMLFTATLGGAIIGFLFYNFNPATIFMGDTGSMFLGFILATTSVMTARKSSTAVAMLIPIVALGLPIMDTLLAIARRAVRGHPLFSADKDHIHHRLLTLGLSQKQVALVLWGVCLLLAITAWMLTWANSAQSGLLLAWLGVMSFLFMRKLGYFPFGQVQEILNRRRQTRALMADVAAAQASFASSEDLAALWRQVRAFSVGVEAGIMGLTFTERRAPGETVETRFNLSTGEMVFSGEPLVATYPIEIPGRGQVALLEVAWLDGREEVLQSHDIALQRLRDHIGLALRAIEAREKVPTLTPSIKE